MRLKFNPTIATINAAIEEYCALLKLETNPEKIKRFEFEIEQLESLKRTIEFEQSGE